MTPNEGIKFDEDLVIQRLTEKDKNLHQRLIKKGLSPEMKGASICDQAESLVEILNDVSGLHLTTEMLNRSADVRNAVYRLLWKMGQEIMAEPADESVDDFDDGKKPARPKYPELVGKRIMLAGIPEDEVDNTRKFIEEVQYVLNVADKNEEMFKHAIEAPLILDRVFSLFSRVGKQALNRLVDQFCSVAFEGKNVVEIVDFVENDMRPEAKKCGAEELMDVVCKCVFGEIGEKLRMGAYDHFGDDNRVALYQWALNLRETNSRLYELFGTALEYLITTNEPTEA